MKLTISKTELVKLSLRCINLVDKKPFIPILECYLLDIAEGVLTLSACDERSIISSRCTIKYSGEPVKLCVPAFKFHDIVTMIWDEADTVSLEASLGGVKKYRKLLIKGGGSKHELPIYDVNELPHFDSPNTNAVFTERGSIVVGMLKNICTLIDEDEHRPQFEGVYISYDEERQLMRMAGGTANRFALCSTYSKMPINEWVPVIIHHNAIKKIDKIFEAHSDISIRADKNKVMISDGTTTIISRCVDEKFPNMWGLYNDLRKESNIKVATTRLAMATKECMIHETDTNLICNLIVDEKNISLRMDNQDTGSYGMKTIEEVSGDFSPATIGLNIHALEEAIKATESITLEIQYPNTERSRIALVVTEAVETRYDMVVILPTYKPL